MAHEEIKRLEHDLFALEANVDMLIDKLREEQSKLDRIVEATRPDPNPYWCGTCYGHTSITTIDGCDIDFICDGCGQQQRDWDMREAVALKRNHDKIVAIAKGEL